MDLTLFINALVGMLVIIDPIGAAIIFHSLAPKDTRQRRLTAIRSTVIALALLIGFGLYGEDLLAALGINMASMRIAGGVLLFYTAFEMIVRATPMTSPEGEHNDISVFPLAIPLLAGPGSLTLAILLFAKTDSGFSALSVLSAITLVLALTLVAMLVAHHIKRIIGRTGDEILRRFLGVILAALAIQFIHDGIVEFMV